MGNVQVAEKQSNQDQAKVEMNELVALCKRRGFIFAASEIYGGINGFWDFGPLGIALKNNLRDRWWRDMVIAPPIGPDGKPLQIVGLDSAIIQNPKAWEASGHVAGFSDPMVDCRETKRRYRQDHLIAIPYIGADQNAPLFVFYVDTSEADIAKRIEKIGKKLGMRLSRSDYAVKYQSLASYDNTELSQMVAPDADKPGTLTEPRAFNLMFKTYVGATATEDDKAYLRPETAQGIFLNFKNVVDSSRVRVPFGIAQVGKAFRNEVTPRNFIYRSREFEQMEMEWFCPPDEAKTWFDFWVNARREWWKSIGVDSDNIQVRPHEKDELSHYAKEGEGTVDIEYRFPFTWPGYGELEGIAHRCAFDLTQHQQHSGVKLEYFDDINQKRYMPHVIEPASGLTRGVLALLAEAYTPDESRPSKMYLKLNPSMAPVKAAILPLTAKDGQPEIAQKLYMACRTRFMTELDIKQNIGKRYARNDEIGTPFCVTIDTETQNDQAATIRFRDTMQQERVGLDKVEEYIAGKIKE